MTLDFLLRARGSADDSTSDSPTTTIVTLPRKHRRHDAEQRVAARKRRTQQRAEAEAGRPHGWVRADDADALRGSKPSFLDRRRADGTPLLLFTVLAVLTGVGLARVESRIEVLDVANEITALSETQQQLLDRKRRLETERAYLRRPSRISEQAAERLGMIPAPAERIQKIELRPAEPDAEAMQTDAGGQP